MGLRTRQKAWPILMAALAAGTLGGCAGSLPGESQAFDRWTEHDAASYGGRHADRVDRDSRDALVDRAAAVELPQQPTLDDYLRYALAHNPGLEAAFSEWKAALQRVPQARALPDPQLSYAYFVRESMTQQTAGLSQMFPWYGRLKARGEAELSAALAAEQRFEAQRVALVARVKDAYAEYAYLRQALAVMQENRRIAEEFAEAAEARFEAGEVPYADVVRADVAVERIEDELASLQDRRPALTARLNAAMGRASHKPLPWPASLEQPAMEADEQQLLARLARQNPQLQALQHEIAQRRHLHRLARQNRIPDLMLGVEYMDMAPSGMRDQVALMGSINLPIYSGRIEAERAEALAAFGAATHRRIDRENELQSELQLSYYRFRDAQRRARLFRERLIPMSQEALEATEAAYAAGELDFQSLTDAQSNLQQMQLTYERAWADRFQHLAELERLVGSGLPEGQGEDDAQSGDAVEDRAATVPGMNSPEASKRPELSGAKGDR